MLTVFAFNLLLRPIIIFKWLAIAEVLKSFFNIFFYLKVLAKRWAGVDDEKQEIIEWLMFLPLYLT